MIIWLFKMYFKMITIKIIKHYFILINYNFNSIFSKELKSYNSIK